MAAPDIDRIANRLVASHKDKASITAAEEAIQSLEAGDEQTFQEWLLIIRAIVQMGNGGGALAS